MLIGDNWSVVQQKSFSDDGERELFEEGLERSAGCADGNAAQSAELRPMKSQQNLPSAGRPLNHEIGESRERRSLVNLLWSTFFSIPTKVQNCASIIIGINEPQASFRMRTLVRSKEKEKKLQMEKKGKYC